MEDLQKDLDDINKVLLQDKKNKREERIRLENERIRLLEKLKNKRKQEDEQLKQMRKGLIQEKIKQNEIDRKERVRISAENRRLQAEKAETARKERVRILKEKRERPRRRDPPKPKTPPKQKSPEPQILSEDEITKNNAKDGLNNRMATKRIQGNMKALSISGSSERTNKELIKKIEKKIDSLDLDKEEDRKKLDEIIKTFKRAN